MLNQNTDRPIFSAFSNPQGTDEDQLVLTVVDKFMFSGRAAQQPVTQSDLLKLHNGLVKLEDGVNRNVRVTHRKANQACLQLSKMSEETNTALRTITVQVETLADKINARIEPQDNDVFLDPDEQEIAQPNPNAFQPIDPPGTMRAPSNAGDSDDADSEDEFGHRINMISTDSSPNFATFSSDSLIDFDRWSNKFQDLVNFYGKKWDEDDKLARLITCLDLTPRRIFNNLAANEKDTLAKAIKNIRINLDSPQRRELTFQSLSICKMREGECVREFLNRLIPLLDATTVDQTADLKNDISCRALLEKLRPEISHLLRVASLSSKKNFETLCIQAQEAEIMLASNPKTQHALFQVDNTPTPSMPRQQPTDSPRGNFRTWAPTNPNRIPLGPPPRFDQNRGRWNNNQSSNAPRGSGNRFQNRNQWQPQNDRRWNTRPICNYCQRVGHFASVCKTKLRDLHNQNRGTQQAHNRIQMVQAIDKMECLTERLDQMMVSRPQNNNQPMQSAAPHSNQHEVRVAQVVEEPTPIHVNKPSRPKSPTKLQSWELPGPRLTPMFMLVAIMAFMTSEVSAKLIPLPSNPMICQTRHQSLVWSLPDLNSCPKIAINISLPPISQKRIIYAPNMAEYSTKGWACRLVKKTVKKYTAISGVPEEQHLEPVMLDLALADCMKMITSRQCKFGQMTNDSGLWETHNKVDMSPRMWFFGSFSWKEASSYNCYAFQTIVNSHFGHPSISTPVGAVENCPYRKGSCILADKTVLFWQPSPAIQCQFRQIGTWEGKQLGNVWLSDNSELGLTITQVRFVPDCKDNLTLTDQGLAYKIVAQPAQARTKRSPERQNSTMPNDGIVPSSQLASQLTYLHFSLTESINIAFAQSFKSFCELIEDTRRWVQASYLSNPTNLARSIFRNDYLVARQAGVELLQVWPCIPLKRQDFEFLPTRSNETCFELLPITFNSQSGKQSAFLDPHTMIVTPTSKKALCGDRRSILIQIEGKTMLVDQVEGKTFDVHVYKPNKAVLNLGHTISYPMLHPLSFRHLVLFNLSDIVTHAFATNIMQVSQFTYKIHQTESEVRTTLSEEWEAVQEAIVNKATGGLWEKVDYIAKGLLLLCVIDLLIRLALTYTDARLGKGRLGRLLFSGTADQVRDALELTTLDNVVIGSPIPGSPTHWPPTVSEHPLITPNSRSSSRQNSRRNTPRGPVKITEIKETCNVLMDPKNKQIALPMLVGRINGKTVRVLLDTGSTVTVVPKSLIYEVKASFCPCKESLCGLGSESIPICGRAELPITMSNISITISALVAEGNQFVFSIANVIMGNDSLKKMGPLRFDFALNSVEPVDAVDQGVGPSTSNAEAKQASEFGNWLCEYIFDNKGPVNPRIPCKYPQSLREVNQVLGVTANYARNHPQLGAATHPLMQLMIRDQFKWGDKEKKAYTDTLRLLYNAINTAIEEGHSHGGAHFRDTDSQK
jgi:hypothetical protein